MTSSQNRREEGTALLEFAVVLPILLSLLLGIVTSGSALNSSNSINNAARESARFGATLPADNLTWWLNKVADVAIESATGDLDDGNDGRYVCVAFVYPAGTVPEDSSVGTDHTAKIEINEAGVKKVTTGSACYTDGRPNSERRVQVLAERSADLEFVFFDRTVTLDGQSTARFERAT
ncbi:MAG: TadE/TadG family type IV pilus assembly protein, partial [Acidimicrobiia bacterium]|nr:TadE/TadG family type IV pilus assembly protein [Acidimicrobiia bacterium]